MKKYFDEFVRLTIPKMAKKMSEMTYLYDNTEVPERHYKAILEETTLEMMTNDIAIQSVLLATVQKALISLQKESPKLFAKALICLDNNIKAEDMDARTYYALDQAYEVIEQNKKLSLLNDEINTVYKEQYANGLPLPKLVIDETDKERS